MEASTSEERLPAWSRPVGSLRFWLIAAALVALLAVGAGAVATAETRGEVDDSTAELNQHLRPAQSASQRLLTAYVDEETGQRGFVLTGQGRFLQPYRSGVRQADRLEAQLADLLHGRPAALTLLADVKAAAVWWRLHAEKEIAAVRTQGAPEVRALDPQRQDERRFRILRSRLGDLQVEMDRLVGAEVARLGVAQDRVGDTMAVATVLAVLALLATVGLLHFALTRPLARLRAQLAAVSSGEYERQIDASGPAETRQLAEAAETMRMSIVDRSAELVAAQHELSVQTERQRMAADLHDTTIQRLFGLGLKLSALASQRVELSGTLNELIDEADEIIRELRRMIFEVNDEEIRASARSARAQSAGAESGGGAPVEAVEPATAAAETSEGEGTGDRAGSAPADTGATDTAPTDSGATDSGATDAEGASARRVARPATER